jgi:hypothetical protein
MLTIGRGMLTIIKVPPGSRADGDVGLKRIGVRDPVVLGHSWGTLVAVALGLRGDYPVRSLGSRRESLEAALLLLLLLLLQL